MLPGRVVQPWARARGGDCPTHNVPASAAAAPRPRVCGVVPPVHRGRRSVRVAVRGRQPPPEDDQEPLPDDMDDMQAFLSEIAEEFGPDADLDALLEAEEAEAGAAEDFDDADDAAAAATNVGPVQGGQPGAFDAKQARALFNQYEQGLEEDFDDETLQQLADEAGLGDLDDLPDEELQLPPLGRVAPRAAAAPAAAPAAAGAAHLDDLPVDDFDDLPADDFDDVQEAALPDDLEEDMGGVLNMGGVLKAEDVVQAGAEAQLGAEGGEGANKYPEPPKRSYFIADLFGMAAYYDAAQMLEQKYPEVGVYGLQEDVARVAPGEMYCCPNSDPEELPQLVELALRRGAFSLLLPEVAQTLPEVQELIPEDLPAFYVDSVDEAAARLAVAFYGAPSRDMLMVGVVGSHGKTTTSWLVRGVLEEMDQVTGLVGSIEVGLAEDRLDADGQLWAPSGPDPTEQRECSAPFMVTPYPAEGKYTLPEGGLSGLQTQKVLAGLRDRGATCCVYEASPAAVGRGLTAWVETSVLVHTCLMPPTSASSSSSSSSDGSGQRPSAQQLRQQAAVQAALHQFERLDDPTSQAVVINLDDGAAGLVMEAAAAVPAVTYAVHNKDADVACESFNFDIWESEVFVRTPLGRLQIITPLLGLHNVYNILAAVATGIALKVPLRSIVAGIEAVEIVPGRCEVVDEGQDFSVIVDCANTPQALEAVLSSLKSSANRIITVFGCKGEEDRSLRPEMAEVAHSLSDVVIITNDSPRREPPEEIVQDIVAGLPDSVIKRYSGYVYFPFQDQGHVPLWFEPYLQKAQRTCKRYVMEDRFSAIRAAIGTASEGDVVLIAGRGHADYMEYDDGQDGIVRGWFDDRVEARSALSKLAYLNQLTRLNRKHLPWGKALEEMETLIDPPWREEDRDLPAAEGQGPGAIDAQAEPLGAL